MLLKQLTDRCKADVWAFGVTFADMLEAVLPYPTVPGTMHSSITSGGYVLTWTIPGTLSDLFRKMSTVKPEARWSGHELCEHRFFTHQGDGKVIVPGVIFYRTRRQSCEGWSNLVSSGGCLLAASMSYGPMQMFKGMKVEDWCHHQANRSDHGVFDSG
jgi:serine/threonine protein kinase